MKMGDKVKNLTDADVPNQRTSTNRPEVVIDVDTIDEDVGVG